MTRTCKTTAYRKTRSFTPRLTRACAEFTHLIKCWNSSSVAPQRNTSSALKGLLRLGPEPEPSGCSGGCEDQRCSSSPVRTTLRHVHADYSDKHFFVLGGRRQNWRRMFCSLSLRSGCSSVHLSSLHMLIFRPRCADEANFSNPQFAQLFQLSRHCCFYHSH